MDEKKKDKIVFHYLQDERRYVLISNGKPVEQIVDEFIKKHDVNIPILCEADHKTVWAHRTAINGLKNEIAEARKQTTAVVINPLKNACMPLEKKLEEVSDKLTAQMEEYKPKVEKPKTTSIITIEYPIGSEEIKKVKTYLNRVKIAYKEEEK